PLVVGTGRGSLLGPTPFARPTAVIAGRAAPAARGVLGVESAPLTVSVDGLAANVRTSSETVADALRGLGIATGTGDRLSSPGQSAFVPGQRLALDRGLPVTLIDGGPEVASPSVRGSDAGLVAPAGTGVGTREQGERRLAGCL